MLLAIISDIHGNIDALNVVLDAIEKRGVDRIINLGDHFSGPLCADKTARRLWELKKSGTPTTTLRGNHDRWLVERSINAMGASDVHAKGQLSDATIDWLKELPATVELSVPDKYATVFACHAVPDSDTIYWMEDVYPDGSVGKRDDKGIEAFAKNLKSGLILCGHTHVPRIHKLSDRRILLNPGSVGCPGFNDTHPLPHAIETGSPDASWALAQFDQGTWSVEHRFEGYDQSRMVRLAAENGRPDWANALATGNIKSVV